MRKLNALITPLLLAILVGVASPALAQQGTAEIRGRVTDSSGGALPGVTVLVRNQASGVFRQGVTSTDGVYFLSGVVPGQYEVSGELSGFKKYSHKDIRLEVGKTATIDIRLEVGGLTEELTVSADAPIVDVTSKEVGGSLTSQDLVSLPSINRNFVGFLGLLPGIVPSISTESFGSDSVSANGQDSRNNNYLVDGANNNDDVIGQRAGTQARTPIESIQEFQVLTSQYDAEFGRTSGAVVNAVTKQGGNEFKGSAFYFLQDASLTEKSFFAKQNNTPKPETRFQQFGFTLGGPVIKNKAHFFTSVERVVNDRAAEINIPARPELNASPVTKDRVWNTLVRFDHQINAKHSWNIRWLRESSPQTNQIIGPVTEAASREEVDVDQTSVATLNSSFGNTKFNTFRVAFTQEDVAFANPAFNGNGGHGDQLKPTLAFQTFTDQQSNVMQGRVNNAYQFDNTFSWFIPGSKGDHSIRAGLQYEYVNVFSSAQDNWNGTFSFSRSNEPFNSADPRTYPDRLSVRVPGPSEYTQKEHFYTAFIQDKWKTGDRLTISLGVRYDLEKIPFQEVDNPRFSNVDDYPIDKNNISPRLGFAYDLSGDGKTAIRGGVGRFYDKSHLELVSAIITGGVFSNSFTATFPATNIDPGPSAGRLPTDPFLVNGPTLNRALLNQLYPAGSKLKNTGTVTLDNPDRVIPYTDQISAGFERQLSRDMSINVDYVHAFGRDQLMRRDLNPGLRASNARTAAVRRVDPNFVTSVLTPINEGRTEYDSLLLGIEKRYSHGYQFRVSYTFSSSRGNTPEGFIPTSSFQLLDDLRLDLNQGPTDFDRPHNFVFSGAARVPGTGGLTFSTIVRYVSGNAFTIQDTSRDNDQNGILFEPLPAGSYSGTGSNAVTIKSDGGRNGALGPSFFQADVRLGYSVKLGVRKVELFGEVFNLTNRANFNSPTGDRFSTNFLRLTSLRAGAAPRTAQLGARFEF
ncbi:MAG: TonB-dependent receptor [Vicinamibacteria bacterium]|nr:TonB-dependent receptor [Vicinamibacteria bacterium]